MSTKPTSTLRRWLTRFVVMGVLGGAVALAPRLFPRKPLGVKVVTVGRGTVRDVVTSSTAGEVVPERHATVRAEMGARVLTVRHKRGERVAAGEVVITLDDADLKARLAQAHAQLAGQKITVGQSRARVATLERQAKRMKMLAERGAAGTSQSDDAGDLLEEAREALRAASGMVGQSEAAVKIASLAVERCRFTAPFDGLLADVPLDPGDELTPGQIAFEIIDDRVLHVNATVDEADAARTAVGQPAELTLDALPGRHVLGKLSTLAPAVKKDLKGARTLAIEVEVLDAAGATKAGLRPGMSANVEIVVAEKPDVPWVPTNVIIGRGVRRTVWRMAGGKLAQVAVEVGISNWERSEVTSGVAAGDVLVSSLSVKGLEEGALVAIEK